MKPFTFLIALFSLIVLSNCKQMKQQTENSLTESVKSSDGVDISYQVHGDGSNALVFIHGWCCDKSYWKEQINYFKGDYKIVIIDLAGHGESGMGRTSYTIQMFANDVTAVINQLQLSKYILIGHSLGAYVVLEVAVQNSESTYAIFPIDGFGNVPEPKTEEELQAIEIENRNRFAEDFKSNVNDFVRGMFVPESDSVLINWVANDMSSNDPSVAMDAYANLMQYYHRDFSNSLKSVIGIPIICIGAGQKPQLEKFKKIHPEFNNLQMEKVGHFLMMEDPETFNALLNEQLQQILSN